MDFDKKIDSALYKVKVSALESVVSMISNNRLKKRSKRIYIDIIKNHCKELGIKKMVCDPEIVLQCKKTEEQSWEDFVRELDDTDFETFSSFHYKQKTSRENIIDMLIEECYYIGFKELISSLPSVSFTLLSAFRLDHLSTKEQQDIVQAVMDHVFQEGVW